jgi:hypothetical protein
MTAVPGQPDLVLDTDAYGLLRAGLGAFDMEIRWLAHIDESNVLRLWRSWTGIQIYQAAIEKQTEDEWLIRTLLVEQEPDRYRGSLSDEPADLYGSWSPS